MIQNVVIVALVGLLLVAIALPIMFMRARQMRLPSVATWITFLVGDLLFTSSAAAIVAHYMLA